MPFSTPALTIADVEFMQTYSSIGYESVQDYSLDVEGRISGELTNDATVTVSTVTPLNRVLERGPLESDNVPFNGQLQMVTSDDSVLSITANPEAGEDQSLSVDYYLANADGEQRETIGAQLVDLPFTIPGSQDWLRD